MGFRQNGFMTVWSVEPSKSGTTTQVRLSSSRKNKQTGEYEQDFSGFCTFIGDAHKNAAVLKERERIRLLECDVSTVYDREKRAEKVFYKVFSFECLDQTQPSSPSQKLPRRATAFEGEMDEDDLPY